MSQHCRANPCCGDRPCSGIPLPQHASGLTWHNKKPKPEATEGVAHEKATLLARVSSIICEETCGLTSACKSREAANALFDKGYLVKPISHETGWQPIDTAPKDGRHVLLYCDYYGVGRCAWESWRGVWRSDDPNHGIGFPHPTHWMPLPEAPAGSARALNAENACRAALTAKQTDGRGE